ncbi:hypothetical protein LTR94_032811, partial [Friedmanniomyces endolithicus]
PPEPAADGPDPAAGVRDPAMGADVRDGAVRGRAADLLDHHQLRLDRAAEVPVQPPSAAEGSGRQVTDDTPQPAPVPVPDDDAAAARIEAGRRLFAGRIDFLKSAPALQFLPAPDAPEVAFAGRSNVGKSSLLNALAGRKALARTSVTPGRTHELNFFD